jgi:hypothetical protein
MKNVRAIALLAVLLALAAPSLARAQCAQGTTGCTAGGATTQGTGSTATGATATPVAAAPAPTSNGAAEDGFTVAATGTFGGDAPLWGGMLTAHFGVLRFLMVDVGFEHALSLDDAVDARETGVTLGLRLIPNPRGRFRIVLPLRVGGLIRAESDTDIGSQLRAVELTADAGLGLNLRLLGPLYLSAIGRAQVRRTPGGDGVDWIGKADVGLTFLF